MVAPENTGDKVVGRAMVETDNYDYHLNALKWVAMASMLLDHIGLYVFNDNPYLRIMGRVCVLIFPHMIIRGSQNTSSKVNYYKKLLLLAIIAQPVFYYLGTEGLNPVFGLLAGLLAVESIKTRNWWMATGCLLSLSLVPWFYVAVMPVMYLFEKRKPMLYLLLAAIIYIYSGKYFLIQGFSLIGLVLIHNRFEFKWKINKHFWWNYYVGHQTAIYIFLMVTSWHNSF